MKLFKYIFLSVASALILMLGGCEKRPSKYRIGVSQCNSDDWRTQMNNEMRREAMFNDDVTLEIRSADDNTEQQIEDIQYFIDSGFDLIIVSPRESAPITPVVKEAFDKGIPVITFDRRIDGESYSAFQGADNTDMGRAVGEWVASRLGESGKIFEIVGLAGSSPATERHNGFMEVIGKYPGLSVVTAESDWTAKRASVVADSVLRRHPDIDLIFAQNDRMAISARHEADKLGLKGITIVGIDAVPETGIKAVEDGTINATFLYPSGGDRIIQTACNILKDRHYERNAILPTGEVIDSTNASILLLQAEGIAGQTTKMERLKSRIDEYWARHSIQTTLLYSVGIILVLAIILIIIGSKAYWMRVRHQQALSLQNAKLEEQRDRLIELQKQVEEATHAKLVFFTNVSHDLRTPLTLISDPIDQIKDADNLTPRQHTLMQLADKNVNVLLRLINQILDFRKYENGKMDFTPVDVDMRQCLTSWAESFKGLSLKKHIHLEVDIDPEADLHVAVDIEKMERIFFNLMSNAFKFTPENGTVKASLTTANGNMALKVSDTGRGMSLDHLKHIFERFYQIDVSHHNGSGIGLALVKSFVDLHGGTIHADSLPDKGTTFTVTIPVRHTGGIGQETQPRISSTDIIDELADVESSDTPLEAGSDCILIIDDNADIRTLVKTLLSDQYTVIEARDGAQGIRLATRYVPDLIICDVMMPVMDGMECCRRLKSELVTFHIPVLMLTACALDEQRIEGYDCGADGYLSKPFNSKMLMARIKSLIQNRKRIKESANDPAVPSVVTTDKATATADADSEFINRLKALIEKDLSDSSLNVEELSERVGMSRVQLYRKVKSLTNYTPVEYLHIIRLRHASRLLASTENTVAEISYKVGFTSPSYFTKCYREYFGESPTEVQKRTSKLSK